MFDYIPFPVFTHTHTTGMTHFQLDQDVTSLLFVYLSNKLAIQTTGDHPKLWLIVSLLNKGGNQETRKLSFELNPGLRQNSACHFQFEAKPGSFRDIVVLLRIYMGDIMNG